MERNVSHYCVSGTTRTTVCCMNTSTMAFVPKEDSKCTHSSFEIFLIIILTHTFSIPACGEIQEWLQSLVVSLNEFRHQCFHSHRYFIVPLRDTRLTILTRKELRCNLLTFTIFIIQSQIRAIPVFCR